MDTSDLRTTAAECATYLDGVASLDWTAPVQDLGWTAASTVTHICDGLLWYATDFVAGPAELSTMDLAVRPTTSPSLLVRTLSMAAETLARVLDAGTPADRGWHPFGLSDASGFAAMACDELLVHTADTATALGRPFTPPATQVARTLHRLFPDAPTGFAPWPTLLWANGRAPLGDVPRREKWTWRCAPLEG
ncbi:maleylpyruvate isomerase N-terminal domain-containing protein [Umezawaea sp. NPDC059074]|uniref:maleylpyruvate isomerase N-terminal domain-containing protein n=1 Tax=Umezawaea sp. NPDC059074 TaxID=3346716 RepID=UPI0036B69A07